MTDPNPLASAAENYARSNWAVFPLKPRDKDPLTTHGLKDASSKIDTVRRWWQKWPDANIGVNCGLSNLVVIDLDMKDGLDGIGDWKEITGRLGIDPVTSTTITGTGGRHLIFAAPPGIEIGNSAHKVAPGIDVRANGGYIVLPPSIHPSGTPYQWLDTTATIAPLPEPLIDILQREPDPWKIYTLTDALRPREPLVWVVDGLLSVGSLSIWYGAPGTLKSMILADMAICVAAGKHWLEAPNGEGGFTTTPTGVFWLDFDNGQRRTHERFAALARTHQVPPCAPLYYVSMPDPYLDAGDTAAMGALAQRVIDRGVSLVVIDNLGVVSGNSDENSAEMQRPMGGLRWLTEATNAAIVVLHHQRKTSGVSIRSGETLRGHGSIEAKIDLGLLITRDEANITLTATKVRGQDVKPFGATFSFENDESRELRCARFWPATPETEESEAELKRAEIETGVIESVRRFGTLSANQAYDQIGGNRAQVLDIIRQMVKVGTLGQKQGARGYLLYVPGDGSH